MGDHFTAAHAEANDGGDCPADAPRGTPLPLQPPLDPDVACVGERLSAAGVAAVDYFAELGSTNDHAGVMLAQAVPLPRVIWAGRQTSGRGRGANRWWSAEGALTFSILVDLPTLGLPPERWPCLALVTGIAVADVLADLLPTVGVGLKWPNDVLLDGRKVCGILTEIPDATAGRAIVGIGINVGNSFRAAPPELQRTVVSIADCSPWLTTTPAQLLPQVVERWFSRARDFAAQRLVLEEVWPRYCVLTGGPVAIERAGELVQGRCEGLGAGGELLVRAGDHLERVLTGHVRWSGRQ